MGMFDDIKCKYPLPLAGANELSYQTKDLTCGLDKYEIREDGSLWCEDYDVEDQSELGKWNKEHPGEEPPEEISGLWGMAGCMTRVNPRWLRSQYTGEICFYDCTGKDHSGWLEWSSYFVDGMLQSVILIENKPPKETNETNKDVNSGVV